ncbi:GNAT family N-acetyltransferase [uncultured Psychromonas sp.]|uniref:GNAT family N-acetyltransferase n=1 Tax=uncultured Psychromonas sp. TaxID=173974 RepID=UPI0034590FE9
MNAQIAAFIELESNGDIDTTYVLPNFQKTGVASTLLEYAMNIAKNSGIEHLYAEASIIAKSVI